LTCLETVHQRPCMMREIKTWLSDSWVGNNSVVDHRSRRQSSLHCVIVSTDVMSDHIGRRDASRGGGCSKTSAYTGQFGCASMIWSILSVATLRHRLASHLLHPESSCGLDAMRQQRAETASQLWAIYLFIMKFVQLGTQIKTRCEKKKIYKNTQKVHYEVHKNHIIKSTSDSQNSEIWPSWNFTLNSSSIRFILSRSGAITEFCGSRVRG